MTKTNKTWWWISHRASLWKTFGTLLCYAAGVLAYNFIFIPPGLERYARLSAGALHIAGITFITLYSRFPPNTKSFLLPFFTMVVELILALILKGDRIFILLLFCWAVISFSYIRPAGLLIYLGLSNAVLIPVIFIFRVNLLGPEFPPDQEIAGLNIHNMIVLFLYTISRLLQKRFLEIEKTKHTFETVLRTTPNYMLITNENAEVEYISDSLAEWLKFTNKKYAIGRPLLDLFRSGRIKRIFQEVMEQSGYVTRDFELTVGGKNCWFMIRSTLLEEESPSRFFEWIDISSIMRAKNEAESAARAKSDFLANISHEIRTPMNAIIGMTDLMLANPLEAEQTTRADTIKGAAFSLLNIINDILDFSKIDARKMEILPQPFDFASFINDTVNMVNLKAVAAGLAFTTAISKDIPPLINADEIRLKQCLVNILGNAVKFTPKGYIHLSAWPEFMENGDLKLHFSIKDTGRGIKQEDIGKLFTEFQQIDTRKNRNIIGTGLGLAITDRLVELMGGAVSVESVYGEGSTFSFYVVCPGPHQGKLAVLDHPEKLRVLCYEPAACNARAFRDILENLEIPGEVCGEIGRARTLLKGGGFTHVFLDSSGKEELAEFFGGGAVSVTLLKEVPEKFDSLILNSLNRPVLINALADVLNGTKDYQKRRSENSKGAAVSFAVKDAKILVVDDNPVNLAVAKGLLNRYGIATDTADDGEDAVSLIQRNGYDIVFMDHMMPGMDGLDATRIIRNLGGRFETIIIIALTANAVSGVREQFLEAGMNDFLAKPIIISELQGILRKYLPAEKIIGV
ncbi:MAG: response regulator [Treponema sp.]|jgi:signal transduction histidine kinase/CheY-like chemotaxis protein|nr:response regulator [Treponema sp.]